jgi:hypothetical protein
MLLPWKKERKQGGDPPYIYKRRWGEEPVRHRRAMAESFILQKCAGVKSHIT